jgi:Flp pilus assembly protein TadD
MLRFVSSFPLALTLLVPSFGQVARQVPIPGGEDYYIEGFVLSPQGKEIPAAKVVVSGFGAEVGQTVFTDTDGRFSFHGLSKGTYRVTIQATGYQEYVVTVDLVGGPQNLRVVLKPESPTGVSKLPRGSATAADLSAPPKARNYYQKGIQQMERREFAQAAKSFQKAVHEYPDFPAAHAELGVSYLQMHRKKEAAGELNKALKLNASSFDAHLGLGLLANDQKNWAEAEKHLLRSRELNSQSWQVHYELGRTYVGLDRLPEAEASLRQARASAPDYPNLYILLGNVYVLEGRYPEAIEEMKYFVKRWPESKVATQVREKLKLLEKEVAGKTGKVE